MKKTVCWLALAFLTGCSSISPEFQKNASKTFQLIEDGLSYGSSITRHDVEVGIADLKANAKGANENKLLGNIETYYVVVRYGDSDSTNDEERKLCVREIRNELDGNFDDKQNACTDALTKQNERGSKHLNGH